MGTCNSDQEKQDIKHSGNKLNDAIINAARSWININIMVVATILMIVACKWEAHRLNKCVNFAKLCKTIELANIKQSQVHCASVFDFVSAVSSTFSYISKVLFTCPSWYLFMIALKPICGLR